MNAHVGPQRWIASFRGLLAVWGLVEERADFDNACYSSKACKQTMQQVYVSCNFCGKAISRHTNGLPDAAINSNMNNLSSEMKKLNAQLNMNALQKHTARFQSCPACRKPTPRCTVCLLNMGSHSGYLTGTTHTLPNKATKKAGTKITPFEKFFTWCQVCRHGGHAEHIEEWFEEHSECPVSDCHCKCSSHDMDTGAVTSYPPDEAPNQDDATETNKNS